MLVRVSSFELRHVPNCPGLRTLPLESNERGQKGTCAGRHLCLTWLLPSTSEWCRTIGLSQVAVVGDRWWDADQAFLWRGHGHTYEALRVTSLILN